MNNTTGHSAAAEIKYNFLNGNNSEWMEFMYSIMPTATEKIEDQIRTIEQAEGDLFKKHGIDPDTIAAKRIFSSDLITHRQHITEYKNRSKQDFFMSVTEQPPSSGVKLTVLGLCLSNITSKHRDGRFFYLDTTSGLKQIWAEHLIDSEADENTNSEKQTEKIFNMLRNKLQEFGATIQDSVVRTWIYTPNVDADYPGIVKARRELFDSINLTKDTHYIASTGIQGGSESRFARVFMDAYAVIGLDEERIHYIQAPEHLSPTHIYGVTFERATAVEIGNTNFLFISGTASIDKEGEIVHPGDVINQTERTLENIDALLDSGNFTKGDLSSFIVYIRDSADYEFVKPIIEKYSTDLPTIYVKAPVCRPGWLIEIEATAARIID